MATIDDELEIILGRSAMDNDMQVPDNAQKLAKAVKYLSTQLLLVYRDSVGDRDAAYPILENVSEIL